ncbi:FecCD family ABC transporter permease [Paenibacillus flagellatus]|uniref:Iron ABC transporter permease n=1 Tax=Paenibacillus flagellatus TaxID=2211139 RepID=A0A2V5JWZ4_9BACL|nr:iron ABC transporter permease [Paenibacillus flagellatus]PYI51339.1 iron ABC transporter permease [Paenibacillus flagellatus]
MTSYGYASPYRSTPVVLSALIAGNLIVLLLHLMLGDYPIPVREALLAAVGGGDSKYGFVVQTLRLPRALVAFLAGAGLALSGVLLQGITRNPLAAPGVVGLNAGASLTAVAAIIVFPSIPVALMPVAAFVGALSAGALSYVLAWRRGLSPVRLLLVGVGLSASAGAIVTFLLTIGKINDAKMAVIWMTGSVYGRSWEHFWPLLPWLLVLLPVSLLLAKRLDVLQLGDDAARGLGSRLELSRGLLLLISIGLAGSAVAMAGTIGFVGLMAPHMSRYAVGAASRRVIPAAALLGGLIVMLADLFGRIMLKPIEIPCGILVAIVGAPYMLYLLYKKRRM